MKKRSVCPQCKGVLEATDRFCGECGFDTQTVYERVSDEKAAVGDRSTASKKSVLIVSGILVFFFLGGGLFWYFSGSKASSYEKIADPVADKSSSAETPQSPPPRNPDFSRAASYLPEPGLKYTFFVNYPDGRAGIVERISAQAVPGERVRVSEVETKVERGEAVGFSFHYLEKEDGTYYVLDQNPQEVVPVIKNKLRIGKTWEYENEFGRITWTVLKMGVELDLGFAVFKHCLVVREDNPAADFHSITYYAPRRGMVLVTNPEGTLEYFRATALEKIGAEEAAKAVIKWSPNYKQLLENPAQTQ